MRRKPGLQSTGHAGSNMKVELIPIDSIRVRISRTRDEERAKLLRESIRLYGLLQPVGVRRIETLPKSGRKLKGSSYYGYELLYGQGRLQAFRHLHRQGLPGFEAIPAIVWNADPGPEGEWAFFNIFNSENIVRRRLSAREIATLMHYDIESGLSPEELGAKYALSKGRVERYMRFLMRASPSALEAVKGGELKLEEIETITTESPEKQELIIDVTKEFGPLEPGTLRIARDFVAKSKTKGTTKVREELASYLSRIRADNRKLKEQVKISRLDHAAISILVELVESNTAFCKALEEAELEFAFLKNHFERTGEPKGVVAHAS